MNKKNRGDSDQVDVAAHLSNNIKRLYRHLQNAPLSAGVTAERVGVLRTIEANEPISVSGLARHHVVRPTTMSRMVASLAADGYIKIKEDKSDRRGKLISLTPLGRRTWSLGTEQTVLTLAAVLERLSSRERTDLATLMARLADLADSINEIPLASGRRYRQSV